ncbi:uncharacterized protein L969DRAFT_44320 [Mixia osmundae IAM 14324]|uniref:Uncharacterized protein n=1 Tax=Mixia osmundae (strain CBS 9802 / IAM 14324 / JCM 22182 / KY 12970) TaxID=764103 RepID=G7E0D6_MIXOS|nr:uncharacterized protein L969DRAFT_44320 [Mixia osmundae IAM 14324]KEI42288.1 hypothetical protein L969DRAFT_44320 [Mixia osmundae IAM 14324]GAA96296.1 hypothetical protein E5Q_02962 [Mixia osmundae IAM 14324]
MGKRDHSHSSLSRACHVSHCSLALSQQTWVCTRSPNIEYWPARHPAWLFWAVSRSSSA